MAKPKLWLGLACSATLIATLVFAGQRLADDNAGLINDALGLSTQKIDKIDSDEVEGSAYTDPDGSLSNEGWKRMIKDSYKYCEELVEQGSVLFKNDNNALPLKENERKISLLGQGSKNIYYRSGAGGAAPNDDLVVSLDQAFESNGFEINHTIFDKYDTLGRSGGSAPMSDANSTIEHEYSTSFYNNAVIDSFGEYGDAAIITFVRVGTENTDPREPKLELNDREKSLLTLVKQQKDAGVFKKVIVLINGPLAMSTDWVDDEQYGVDACVFMGVPGYYGCGGIVHFLTGVDADGKVVNPSGHAVDTFAASASSSPAMVNALDSSIAVYAENIYVGYKYYETRYEDLILGQGNADSTKGVKKSTGAWNYAEEVGFPFGYGMSYTTFEEKLVSVKYNAETDQYDAKVQVKNTGDMDGKASVQLYVQQPFTEFDQEKGLEKSAIALMQYEKVDLAAGEQKEVELSFDRYFLCTYDYVSNREDETQGGYILEGGDYYFAVGNGAHEALNNIIAVAHPEYAGDLYDHQGEFYAANTDAVKKLVIEQDLTTFKTSHYSDVKVVNQFDDADYNWMADKNNKTPIKYLSRLDWDATWPTKISSNPATSSDSNMQQYYQKAADCPSYAAGDGGKEENEDPYYNIQYIDDDGEPYLITFNDMAKVPLEGEVTDETSKFYGKDGAEIWDAFIKQMELSDLIISVSDNRGILDVKKVLKRGNSVAEGPEGLLAKFQYGDKRWATGFPTGPTYTGTFDHKMQERYGGFFGEESLFAGVACVNAVGANINRIPYGSRASEYMSEDGICNYLVASNIVGAARRKGLIMNIKHCFLNNQETGRQRIHTYCNEQAIREIYLRPFEGALTKGHGLGIMTSYNRIGARYAACHEPLMNNVMRGEWAYKGQIIDDALTGSNNDQYSNGPAMLHSGTDIFCLDGGRGRQLSQWVTSNDDGQILMDLQRANKYVMYAISRSWMGGVRVTEEDIQVSMNPWWKKAVTGMVIGSTAIAACLFGVYAFFEIFELVGKKKAASEPESVEQEVMIMEKIKEFLKNKGVGYYIVAGLALLSLIVAIVFFATYNNPELDPIFHANPMGNKASGLVPETIGIFLLAGFAVELVVLAVPQYRFIQVVAILMFGLALYKEVLIIPDFFAGIANHVMYNGGNVGLNMFFLVALLLIVIAAVVAVFIGFFRKEEDVKGNFVPKGATQFAITGVAAVVLVAAVASSTIISSNLVKKSAGGGGQSSQNSEKPAKKDPITDEMRAAAEANDYDFDPTSVKIEQQEEYDYSDSRLSGLSYSATREGHNLVYIFEGEYSEGYQGQYNTYLSGMYLWDDGVFAGKSNSTTFKGFWFNSSLTAPADDPETEEDESIDCLNMISNTEHFESIIAEPPMGGSGDFYEVQSYIFMHPGWGDGRSVVVSGYKYYPDVAAFIDTNDSEQMKVGEKFVVNSTWFFDKVIKNLKYTQIIPTSEIKWTLPDGMIDDSKRLLAAGEYEITAKWKDYEATATLTVTE